MNRLEHSMKSVGLLIVLSTCVLAACSGPQHLATVNSPDRDNYRVKYGDVVEITFEDNPELNQLAMVHVDGTIRLVALGSLEVINLPLRQIETLVTEGYRRFLHEPVVSLKVFESSQFSVYIGGDIKSPGVFKFRGDMTVVQGIILAGGLVDQSADYEVVIFRNDGAAGVKTYKFGIKKSEQDGYNNRYFKLAPYDVVFVMKAMSKAVRTGIEI